MSWHNANSVGKLYFILFMGMKYLPVRITETKDFDKKKGIVEGIQVEGTGSMKKERGLEAIQNR